jgi:UDP-N-acetyl-D-galactosamine dehydrogenase
LKFFPGLVGGHCIGVDPYYLTYKAKELGYHAQIINAGRFVNDSMGGYIARQTVKKIIAAGKHISESKVLVMGATFKEDVSDIRNSKVVDVINELVSFGVTVEIVDPHANSDSLKKEYGIGLTTDIATNYDAVVVAVNHADYTNLDEAYFQSITTEKSLLVDIKGIYRGKIKALNYWSL